MMTLGLISLFTCEALLILLSIYMVWSWISKTPFYPSSLKRLNQAYQSGQIKLPENFKFIDIGSGDGRIVLWAAKKGAQRAHGIEFNPFLSLTSKGLLLVNGVRGKTEIFNKNFFNHDYSKYDVVYMYIFPEHMEKLQDKLFKELPKGAMIITNTFKLRDVEPDQKLDRFYVYYVK